MMSIFQIKISFNRTWFLLRQRSCISLKKKDLTGAPDLVIEVLSPGTSQLDYGEKKLVYEKYGVSEYFIVDPETSSVDYFYLKKGIYEAKESVKDKIISNILDAEIAF